MPTISGLHLTLTCSNHRVTIAVQYKATFSPHERQLAARGMVFRERIAVIGVDFPGATAGAVLDQFPQATLAVGSGAAPLTIARDVSRTVSRSLLQHDILPGELEMICCRVRITSLGPPPAGIVDAFTPAQQLLSTRRRVRGSCA